MKRHLLHIDPVTHHWHLEALRVETLDQDPRQDYGFLSGEALCQYVLRRDADALIIARGPLPFLAGNKAAVGYVSPLTGLPHYSFVGGRAAAQLLNLGLDAVVLGSTGDHQPLASVYVVARGRAPNLKLDFRAADGLPSGQRGAFYWLRQQELEGDVHAGSIFTLGEAARLGYHTANVAVDAIYHAGRGGAGAVFARHAAALVLRGEPMTPADVFIGDDSAFGRNPNRAIAHLLERYCDRLSADSGGTITKLRDTGAGKEKTLPAWNARRLGTPAAALASPEVLRATRQGRTGCHWCPVDCRHFHYIEADYASEGRDLLLDDFEPTYALFAMLGLTPASDTPQAVVDLRAAVERRLVLPIEQMGCDVLDIGLGLAALFEGVNRGMIPRQDVPEAIIEGDLDNLEAATRAVALLRSGEARSYPGLRAVGDGPQALAERYPAAEEIVFTGGSGTLGNAGHANALWTFLMPFSRFFGHYVGQLYKIDEELPPPDAGEAAYRACFQRVVRRMLEKEFFWVLCNALSMCAFTFVIFSQDGKGERLSEDQGHASSASLIEILRYYGIRVTRTDLEWFAQAFWAQSIDFKIERGWRPPTASDFPHRVYEALSLALQLPPEELRSLMAMLIEEWKRQAGGVMKRFGYGQM